MSGAVGEEASAQDQEQRFGRYAEAGHRHEHGGGEDVADRHRDEGAAVARRRDNAAPSEAPRRTTTEVSSDQITRGRLQAPPRRLSSE